MIVLQACSCHVRSAAAHALHHAAQYVPPVTRLQTEHVSHWAPVPLSHVYGLHQDSHVARDTTAKAASSSLASIGSSSTKKRDGLLTIGPLVAGLPAAAPASRGARPSLQ